MLTVERIKEMPITMAILKEIKETYGVPEKASANTLYGIECYEIRLYGLDVTYEQLRDIANKHRTDAMRDADDELDRCDVFISNDIRYIQIMDDITPIFEEI